VRARVRQPRVGDQQSGRLAEPPPVLLARSVPRAALREGRHGRARARAPPPGPAGGGAAHSFITAVELRSAERMVAFCRAVQRSSPVGAYVQPEPGVRDSP